MSQKSFRKSPVPFQELCAFAESLAQAGLGPEAQRLYSELVKLRTDLDFPAVKDAVGSLLGFVAKQACPQIYFEFGSGYGHSAFWLMNIPSIEKMYLTERRPQLAQHFEQLPWPLEFKQRIHFHFGDALEFLPQIPHIDLAFLDGQKAQYLEVLGLLEKRMGSGGTVLIDNAFFKGHFLDPESKQKHPSLQKLAALYDYLKTGPWESCFLPISDGVLWLVKK